MLKFTGVKNSNPADQIEGDAIMSISVIENLSVLKVDVTLFGIPINDAVGEEVTVNFHTDINND